MPAAPPSRFYRPGDTGYHGPPQLSPAKVEALRQLLISHGYDIAPKGKVEGGAMRSALDDFLNPNKTGGIMARSLDGTTITGRRDPAAWNHAHPKLAEAAQLRGDSQHTPKQVAYPHPGVAPTRPNPHAGPSGAPHAAVPHALNSGGGAAGPADFGSMLLGLLGQSGTQKMLPTSLAGMAAAPDTTLAGTLQSEIGQLPNAKQQALANISNWFGQVQKAQSDGATADQASANAGSAAALSNAKGIMASLGGSAMPGSAQIGAMGTNDANTMQAIGASDASLANELAPIFKLSEAGAKDTTSKRFDQTGVDLQNQLGQAQGQGQADKAAALMQILAANNQGRQSNFSNKSGLLNTLASLQISGQNAASEAQYRQLEGALGLGRLRVSQQRAAKSTNKSGYAGATPDTHNKAYNEIISSISQNGQPLSGLSWPDALRRAQDIVHGYGWNPFNPAVIGGLIKPALSSVGINFTDPTAYNG